jgi:hypothetical protein
MIVPSLSNHEVAEREMTVCLPALRLDDSVGDATWLD